MTKNSGPESTSASFSAPGGYRFYDYIMRETEDSDLFTAIEWTRRSGFDPALGDFWIKKQPDRENLLVMEYRPVICKRLAFFQLETVPGAQYRLHIQESPVGAPIGILRMITPLVPLIEKALVLRRARAIFFTSHSSAMAKFMADTLGYRYIGEAGAEGVIMAKMAGEF